MKITLKFIVKNIFFWYFILSIARILFLLIYAHNDNKLTVLETFQTFVYGFRLDIAIASYVSVFISIILLVKTLSKHKLLDYIYYGYVLLSIIVFIVIISGDLVMYRYWNFRMDATPLFYLNNLNAATASISISKIIILVAISIFSIILVYFIYLKSLNKTYNKLPSNLESLYIIVPSFVIYFLLIRGGWGIASLSTSTAYFSEKPFCNHAAVNPVWNVGFSLTEKDDLKKEYVYYDSTTLKALLQPYFTDQPFGKKLLKTSQPNIILIITESLTAKALAYGGDTLQVMPSLNKLINEGILFNNVYAASERTDKGLAAVIAGYPSLPGSSPLKYQRLTEKLAFLPEKLKNAGYNTEFYYGGTLNFANYGSFLIQAGFQKIVSDKDFPSEELESKWGAYDHNVFKKFLTATPDTDSAFFKTILTLTSHEPFIIPIKAFLPGSNDDVLFLNSLHYTDQVLNDFISKAKNKRWWDNTLIIITADHGSILPGQSKNWEAKRFHIPVLWLGGVLNVRDTIIPTLSSQIDIASTLLGQLEMEADDFTFSRNILSPNYSPRAFFTFTNGFGWMQPERFNVFNTITKKYNDKKPYVENLSEKQGKAYLQMLFEDFKMRYHSK